MEDNEVDPKELQQENRQAVINQVVAFNRGLWELLDKSLLEVCPIAATTATSMFFEDLARGLSRRELLVSAELCAEIYPKLARQVKSMRIPEDTKPNAKTS